MKKKVESQYFQNFIIWKVFVFGSMIDKNENSGQNYCTFIQNMHLEAATEPGTGTRYCTWPKKKHNTSLPPSKPVKTMKDQTPPQTPFEFI